MNKHNYVYAHYYIMVAKMHNKVMYITYNKYADRNSTDAMKIQTYGSTPEHLYLSADENKAREEESYDWARCISDRVSKKFHIKIKIKKVRYKKYLTVDEYYSWNPKFDMKLLRGYSN